MQRYFARIVRALIVSLLGFGGGVGLMVFVVAVVVAGDKHAFQHGLTAGVLIGGIFAVLLVCVLLPLDLTAHLFAAKGRYKEIWELSQTRELILSGSLKESMSRCRAGLLAVPSVKSVSDHLEARKLRASIGTSWRSHGELMEVMLEPAGESQWKAICTSQSMSQNVLFDYAKNFDNIEAWMKAVSGKTSADTPA